MIFKKKKEAREGNFSQSQLENFIKKFQYKEALQYVIETLKANEENEEIYFYYIGLYYIVNRKLPENIKKIDGEQLLKKYQYSGKNELLLGIYLYLSRENEKYLMELLDIFEIFGYYDEILKILDSKFKASNEPQILNKYGFTYWQKKEYKKALSYFKKSLVINPDPIVYNSMALIYNELGDQILAEKYFKEGLKNFHDNYTLLTNYAVFLFNLGEFEKSGKLVKKIKSMGLNIPFLHSGIGKILKPEYEINLEEELKREPKNNSLVLEIGKYLLRKGDIDQLINFITNEMEKGNVSPKIYSLLSYAYYYKNDFSKSEMTINRGLEQYPDDLTLLLTKVSLDIHRGKNNSIINTLQRIKKLDKMYIEALFNVAMILEGRGMNTKAKRFYEWYIAVSDNESTKLVAQWHLDVINSKLKINIKKEDMDEEFF